MPRPRPVQVPDIYPSHSPMKIGIVGAGKVGATIATLLEACRFCTGIVLADSRSSVDLKGLKKSKFRQVDVNDAAQLAAS